MTSSIKYDDNVLDFNPKKVACYDNLLWIFCRFMTPLLFWIRLVIRSPGLLLWYRESVANSEDLTLTVSPRTFSSKRQSALFLRLIIVRFTRVSTSYNDNTLLRNEGWCTDAKEMMLKCWARIVQSAVNIAASVPGLT